MRTRIKICCIASKDEADQAIAAGADALGLVAKMPSGPGPIASFLLDSGRPNAANPELGGTGRAHDWNISAAFVKASPKPVFLAGGLTGGNVSDAIRQIRPFGVDLCSGVRTAERLDPAKLGAFVAAVRQADGG